MLAAAWPLTAEAVSPVLLPTVIAFVVAAVVVIARPEYGLAAALVLAPFTNYRFGASSKPFHLLLPALVFGLLVYALLVPRRRVTTVSHWLAAAVVFLLAVGIASALNGLDASGSVNKLFLLATAVGMFFAVRELATEPKHFAVVAGGAITGLLLASLQGIYEHAKHKYGVAGFLADGHFVGRIQGSFGHPNQYGGYLVFLIPVAAAIVLTAAFSIRLRVLALAAVAAAVPALIFSYARGAIVALALGVLVWLGVMRPRWALGLAAVFAAVAVLFAPATLKERFSPQASSGDVPLRTDVWGAAIDIAQNHPWLGAGLGDFSDAYRRLPSTLSHASQRRLLNQSGLLVPPHAQNLYLNVLAEEGVLGVAALMLFAMGTVAVVYRGSRAREPTGRAICLGTGAGVVTVAFHSILEVTLFTELSLPFFALVAVALTVRALDRDDPAAAIEG